LISGTDLDQMSTDEMTAGLDYEKLARYIEEQESVPAEPGHHRIPIHDTEVRTKGPVLIDTVSGAVRDATSQDILVPPPIAAKPEKEVDAFLIYLSIWCIALCLVVIALLLSPWSPSQKCAAAALVIIILGERIWYEVRRAPKETAPEGVIHVSQADPESEKLP
jgi:hypothetical protein